MTNEEAIKMLEYIKHVGNGESEYKNDAQAIAIDMAIKAIEQQSKIGHWINLENTKYKGQVLPFWDRYECSRCGGHGQVTFNYCPNCRARMSESEDKE